MKELPVISLPPDPYLCGFLHGRALQKEIQENLALYRIRLEKELNLAWHEGLRRGRWHLERLSAYAPDYLQAVVGVAAGAGLSPAEAGFLDARYEIFYAEFASQARAEECTVLAVLPSKTPEGEVLLAQNWDWVPEVKGFWMRVEGPALTVLAFTEAGIPGGKIGLNSCGLALCINGLVSSVDRWDGEGLPFHARTWNILHAQSLREAEELVTMGLSPCSANFLIAMEGKTLCLERSPTHTFTMTTNTGFLVHTNHFIVGGPEVLAQKERTASKLRLARAEELLAQKASLSEHDLFQILSDHQGFPESICRHPTEDDRAGSSYSTVLSCVINPVRKTLTYVWGTPCMGTPKKVEL